MENKYGRRRARKTAKCLIKWESSAAFLVWYILRVFIRIEFLFGEVAVFGETRINAAFQRLESVNECKN